MLTSELTNSEILKVFERWTGCHHYLITTGKCKTIDDFLIPLGRLLISEANRKLSNPNKWKGIEIKQ